MQAYEDVEDVVLRREYIPGRKVEKVYFSSKDQDAGKEYIEYCAHWLKGFNAVADKPVDEVIDQEKGVFAKVIKLKAGQKIYSLTSAPTAFNSKGGKIVWDEAALHKAQRQMWSGAQPAAMWGYPIRILSTHKGKKTLFYKFIQDIKKGKLKWSHHKVTLADAVRDGLADKIYGRTLTDAERADFIEETRRNAGLEEVFMEDYMCEPQDSTTAYFPYELLAEVLHGNILVPFEQLKFLKGDLYAGWDIARKRDFSVVYIIEKLAFVYIVRYIQRFEKTRFKIQYDFCDKVLALPNLHRMCIDESGMGIPIVERTKEADNGSKAEGVTMTNSIKEVLVTDVKRTIEDKFLWLPDDDVVEESFHSIQKDVTAAGNIRFDADRTEETGHADDFWACALARHAAKGGNGDTWAASSSEKIPAGVYAAYTGNVNSGAY